MKDQNKHSLSMNKILKALALIIPIALLMAACSPAIPEPTLDIQATLAHNVSGTLTAAAPTAQIPALTPFPTHTQSSQPAASYSGLPAQVNVLNIIMRSGPSTLFDKITTFPQGTEITIMGKIANGEWVWVITPQPSSGWMSSEFLSSVDLTSVPNIDVLSSFKISGNVIDMAGQGVDGVDIAVFQGNGSSQLRTDTYSLADGSFMVYLPDSSQGNWNIGTAGISCTSRIMDPNCKATGSIITPTYSIALPQAVSLFFTYNPNQP